MHGVTLFRIRESLFPRRLETECLNENGGEELRTSTKQATEETKRETISVFQAENEGSLNVVACRGSGQLRGKFKNTAMHAYTHSWMSSTGTCMSNVRVTGESPLTTF